MSTAADPSSSTTPRLAGDPAPDPTSFIRIRTTLPRRPLSANAVRQPILTERLLLRPFTIDDLPALRELRTQPEVMYWTMAGVPDKDLDETRAKLEMCLPPKDEGTFNFAICDRETKEFIGMGGCHMWKGSWGWPDVGYLMRKEVWGKGLATEFLRGWLAAWDGLEREEVELEVDGRTVDGMVVEEGGLVREQLIAVTAVANNKSQGVLRKGGFEWFVTWLAHDPTKGTGPDMLIELPTYRHFSGGMKGE